MVDFENRSWPAGAENSRERARNGFGRRRPERSVLFVREYRKRRKPPFAGRPHLNIDTPQRMLPVWPCEYRPGCGHTVSPCGSMPTGMRVTFPVVVSNI